MNTNGQQGAPVCNFPSSGHVALIYGSIMQHKLSSRKGHFNRLWCLETQKGDRIHEHVQGMGVKY